MSEQQTKFHCLLSVAQSEQTEVATKGTLNLVGGEG